jgi:CubicO group peptidase (beta-lactamase class C family)
MAEGYAAPGFERVREAFDAQLPEEMGAGFAAIRDGEVVVDIWGGWADREHTRPWLQNTIVPVYSTTKGISALVMALLVDRGLIEYDAATASLWPSLACTAKTRSRSRRRLRIMAGVPGFSRTDRSGSCGLILRPALRRSLRLRRCGSQALRAAIIR